ncbi:hypothetical protein [Oculatella sp. LEGE 06141]|uniref:hypothetical protein n=1 Tax=Oculatella sp. LEGE 06141 TaxID=1828648 RepID=UPI00187DF5E7|nr:hypothetical protein [Oculatella sp. LEGE 06141]
MNSSKLAELATANFELNRLVNQIQRAQTACHLTAMDFQIALQSNDLAFTRYQQAQVALALKIVLTAVNTVKLTLSGFRCSTKWDYPKGQTHDRHRN